VAHRLIHAFDVLLTMAGRVGPKEYGTAWPVALKEFSDLVEDEIKSARDAYAAGIRRPTAEEISMSDEALAWPLKYAAHEPMACDAVLLWAMCKAGGFSIARIVKERTVKAKAMAERMAAAEWERTGKPIEQARKRAIVEAGRWRDEQAEQLQLNIMGEDDKAQAWADLTAQMRTRIDQELEGLKIPMKPTVLPWQAMPEKILSRSSLDRYLPAGLSYLAEQLHRAHVPVR
jgi:hypothetical protein